MLPAAKVGNMVEEALIDTTFESVWTNKILFRRGLTFYSMNTGMELIPRDF